jgi:Zn-finger nucleic acid-binding protein
MHSCPECSGSFCDVAVLKEMVSEAQKTLRPEFHRKPSLSVSDPIKYLRCPTCDELMNRHNFGQASGVILDVCLAHGVWFEDGELAQVLSFCSSTQATDATKLDKLLRQGQRGARVIPLDFPDTAPKPIDQMSPREMALDVLSCLRLLLP